MGCEHYIEANPDWKEKVSVTFKIKGSTSKLAGLESSVDRIGASVQPATPLLVEVVELVEGFPTSHQRPQTDDVVTDQL